MPIRSSWPDVGDGIEISKIGLSAGIGADKARYLRKQRPGRPIPAKFQLAKLWAGRLRPESASCAKSVTESRGEPTTVGPERRVVCSPHPAKLDRNCPKFAQFQPTRTIFGPSSANFPQSLVDSKPNAVGNGRSTNKGRLWRKLREIWVRPNLWRSRPMWPEPNFGPKKALRGGPYQSWSEIDRLWSDTLQIRSVLREFVSHKDKLGQDVAQPTRARWRAIQAYEPRAMV